MADEFDAAAETQRILAALAKAKRPPEGLLGSASPPEPPKEEKQ